MTEHDDVIRLLREGRPQATDMELDAIKQRVRRRAADPSRRNQSMKSRFAILSMLVAGMLFSTAGAGLALSGKSNHQASVAQYSTPTPTPPPCTPKNSNQPGGNDQTPPGGSGQSEDCAPCTGTNDVAPSQTGSGQAPECTPTPEGGVLPAESGNAPTTGGGTKPKPAGGVLPAEATQTQPTRQEAAATNSQLPFTGFAAIPVLLGGLALLTGGLILRRRTRSE
jgi:hypothetical protein